LIWKRRWREKLLKSKSGERLLTFQNRAKMNLKTKMMKKNWRL
jgi:hypothetical protein